jgi:LCP family protein required for cell wall assembly
MKLKKVIAVICVFVSILLFAGGISVLSDTARIREPKVSNTGELSQPKKITISEPAARKDPVNVLIIGVDDEEIRADVIMLFNYNPELGKINILSIPRDTRIKVRNRIEKINALIAMGGETMLVKGIEQITGLPVQYYARLNFKGFREIIDTLGGVEVDVPMNMIYSDPAQGLYINLKKGRQVLDGRKAEQYVRYRKGNKPGQGYEDGDIGRNKAQQQLVRELISQKLKVKYLSKAQDIYHILSKHAKTNIKLSDLIYYLKDIRKIDCSGIMTFTAPGDSKLIKRVWYFICDLNGLRSLIDKHFFK